ncbi:MaoC/PaaZ C-terminal domain-containing protein [Chloroflexota bacterium]
MDQQLLYEDVEVGVEIPMLVKYPTTQKLVMWAGAANDYYQIHYDKDFAQSTGLNSVIVHGWLTFSFIAQMVTDWIGESGTLKKINCSYKGMHYPNEEIFCKGKVTKKYLQGDECCVECDIWAENREGTITTPGSATFTLPSYPT